MKAVNRRYARQLFIILTLISLLVISGGAASAQKGAPRLDFTLTPTYGSINLNAGFIPDPQTVSVTSGGSVDVSYLGGGCVGFAANAPDYRVSYTSTTSSLLRFYFIGSSGDTTLIVNDPSGNFHCDDDSYGVLDPTVDFTNPVGGTYDIWVGSLSSGAFVSGTLYVTELDANHPGNPAPNNNKGGATRLDFTLAPNYGAANVNSGFIPDPQSVSVTSGGVVDVSYLGGGCTGFAATAPDYRVSYTSANASLLRFYFVGNNGDTTMIVNDPAGNFHCIDDSYGTLDPAVDFSNPAGGTYDIWIGSFASGTYISGTLYITELDGNHPVLAATPVPNNTGGGLDYSLTPNYGTGSLSAGFIPDPKTVSMTSGGSVNVSYLGNSCTGFAANAPDYRVTYTASGSSLLRFYFIGSSGDTTMIVNDPAGNYHCVDDSFGTLNPTVDFSNPSSGTYDIWVGSLASGTFVSGTLNITELAANHP